LAKAPRIHDSLVADPEIELNMSVPHDDDLGVDSRRLSLPRLVLRSNIAVEGIARCRMHEEVTHPVEDPDCLPG
jgi:hypothetical protein